MSTQAALLALTITALGTYAMRGGLILLLADRTLPDPIERALRYVGPAVLAALTVSLAMGGDGDTSLDAAETLAIGAACVVAWRTKNLLLTLLAGMATLLVLSQLI